MKFKKSIAYTLTLSMITGLTTNSFATEIENIDILDNYVENSDDLVIEEVEENDLVIEEVEENDLVIEETEENDLVIEEVEENDLVIEEVEENDLVIEEVEENDLVIEEVEENDLVIEEVEENDLVIEENTENDVDLYIDENLLSKEDTEISTFANSPMMISTEVVVSDETELLNAISTSTSDTIITLTADIELNSKLMIEEKEVTIDLDGYDIIQTANNTRVIEITASYDSKLTLKDSNTQNRIRYGYWDNGTYRMESTAPTDGSTYTKLDGGAITGGVTNSGGGIYIYIIMLLL